MFTLVNTKYIVYKLHKMILRIPKIHSIVYEMDTITIVFTENQHSFPCAPLKKKQDIMTDVIIC